MHNQLPSFLKGVVFYIIHILFKKVKQNSYHTPANIKKIDNCNILHYHAVLTVKKRYFK